MAGIITIPGMFLTGDHASRPAANTVGIGSLYACSDHTKVYQSDGSSWSDWFDPSAGSGSSVAPWYVTPDGGAINLTNRTTGAANRAIIVPCTIPADCTLTGVRIVVGTQNGNISVGLYDSSLARVATSGAVACPATGVNDVAFSGNYSASAGRYYLGLSADNNTATFAFNQQVSSGVAGPVRGLFMATAHPLPNPFVSAGTISAATLVGVTTISPS